jgi:hypothetical protein
MIPRDAADTLERLAGEYPVVTVTGPRQSGKTTLVRALFRNHPYVSLEEPDLRAVALEDPRGFLAAHPDGAVLDEVQRAPDLLSYLQPLVDQDPRPGRYVLTGSQQLGLLSGIAQSLAGRVALVKLLPFTLGELESSARAPATVDQLLIAGLYPPVHDRRLDPTTWYANYVETYLERDVRQLVNVRDLTTFRRFLRLCAGRSGQLLNLSGLASDAGISHNTARAWISVLEASFLVHLLPPYHWSFSKRLVKTPKLYFLDPGLATWLMGVRALDQLAVHPLRGAIFEGGVVSEVLKRRYNRGLPPDIYFWRDRSGHEVDLLREAGTLLTPIEVKSGQTIAQGSFTSLRRWAAIAGETAGPWLPGLRRGRAADPLGRQRPALAEGGSARRPLETGAAPDTDKAQAQRNPPAAGLQPPVVGHRHQVQGIGQHQLQSMGLRDEHAVEGVAVVHGQTRRRLRVLASQELCTVACRRAHKDPAHGECGWRAVERN